MTRKLLVNFIIFLICFGIGRGGGYLYKHYPEKFYLILSIIGIVGSVILTVTIKAWHE